MFIPLRTDRNPRRPPRAVPILIAINVLVHLAVVLGAKMDWPTVTGAMEWSVFDPREFHAWQLVSYQFLHEPGSVWHVAFNMLFLWVFGAAVESRLGRLGFTAFYLCGGAVAALGHMLVNPAPVIGASGAVAGVTGAFLALFPRSRIKVLSLFIVIGVFEVPSLWFIGLYFAVDLLNQTTEVIGTGDGRVAYMAHLAGYAYGFGVAFTLLATKVLRREEFDVFFLFSQAKRRAAMRAATQSQPMAIWDAPQADSGRRLDRAMKRSPTLSEDQRSLAEQRSKISRLIASHDLPAAAQAYREMAIAHADAVLLEGHQLDVANQLCAEGDDRDAASAYELLLRSYPASPRLDEVRLILGVLYARRLSRPERARELLEIVRPKLRDPRQAALADQLSAELAAHP